MSERTRKAQALAEGIAQVVRMFDLDAEAAFKAAMSYAIEVARHNVDKAAFLELAAQGWDLQEELLPDRAEKAYD